MNTEIIYLIDQNGFLDVIQAWADQKGIEVATIDPKNDDLIEVIDGLAIFHENHNFTKDTEELQNFFSKNNRPTHKIDINGTLAATVSNYTMWIERNKTKRILMLGSNEVVANPNLARFLKKLS